jgi:predicted ArsR family transcriptional regulator
VTTLDQVTRLALLGDPTRHSLYLYVVGQSDPVSREQAASATGASRDNAAFHLDKLVEAGLLEATFRRLGGRTGPGAGRPSKLYQRGAAQLQVSVPPRRYELVAELLAQGFDQLNTKRAPATVATAARRAGMALGAQARPGRGSALRRITTLLDEQGFEPLEAPRGVVRLRNCPFHEVSQRHPDLVCSMNQAFMEGVIDGAGAAGVTARLDPQPGRCCVTLHSGPRGPADRG